jgi:hypothetical protein
MIDNDEQLEQTRGAITHLEDGLAALKRDVLPLNRARFAMMAEPVVSHIRALRAQVEDYVGVTSAISELAFSKKVLDRLEAVSGDETRPQ